MRKLKIFVAVLLVVLLLIVVLQNTETVKTKLLFAEVSMPRAALLALTLVVGFAAGFLASVGRRRRKKA